MNTAMIFMLPVMLALSACSGGGSANSSTTTSSGQTATNPKTGSEPAQKFDPDDMMKRPPIGNKTANGSPPTH